MIKILVPILSILFLVSCSSTKTSKDIIELDDLDEDDFKVTKQVRYKQSDDQFAGIKSDDRPALNTESLARMEDPSDLEIKGVIDEITISCYEKEFEKAFSLIREKSSSYKRNPIFWNQVGTCFMLKGERRKALLFYNKALEFKASYAPAYNNLGYMYKLEGEDQKALVAFTRSKKSNRYARTPLFNLGNLYLEYGLYNQAIGTFGGLYNLNKKDVDIINGLAVANLMKGDLKRSMFFYEQLDKDYLEKPNFGVNYAYLLYKQNKRRLARDILSDLDVENLGPWKEYYSKLSNLIGDKK
jgi:tetratricopeptide (TPR) repeat protein